MSKLICPICCYSYTKKVRCKYTCSQCYSSCCQKCIQNFLLNHTVDITDNTQTIGLVCLFCKKTLAFNELVNMPKRFMNQFKRHCKNVLFKREQLYCGETIELAKVSQEIQKIQYYTSLLNIEFRLGILEVKPFINQLRKRYRYLRKRRENWNSTTQFRPCLQCFGFVAIESMTCLTCSMHFCKQCWNPNSQGHQCDQKQKESIQFIELNYEPCPTCYIYIEKQEGCSQMFCTQCHSAFSWATKNRLSLDSIHNPHFEQFKQKDTIVNFSFSIPQTETQLIDLVHQLQQILHQELDNIVVSVFYEFIQKYFIELVYLNELKTKPIFNKDITNINTNRDLRIKYITGKLNKVKFQNILFKRYLSYECFSYIYQKMNQYHIKIITEIKYHIQDFLNDDFGIDKLYYIRQKIWKETNALNIYCQYLFKSYYIKPYQPLCDILTNIIYKVSQEFV